MAQNLSTLFKLVGRKSFAIYLLLGLLSGLLTFMFVRLVSLVISLHISGEMEGKLTDYLLVFAFIILLGIIVLRALSMEIIRISQTLFWQIRPDLVSQVLITTLEDLVSTRKERHAIIISDVNVLTQAPPNIIGFTRLFLLMVLCSCYLLSDFLRLWAITFLATLVGAMIYQLGSGSNIQGYIF